MHTELKTTTAFMALGIPTIGIIQDISSNHNLRGQTE